MNGKISKVKIPVPIGLCFNITVNESSILKVMFDIDFHYLEDKGRSDIYQASFTYDFQKGLLLDWQPENYSHIRPGERIDFSLYYEDSLIFSKAGEDLDDINDIFDSEIVYDIHKKLTHDNIRELIEEVITKICPETNLI